MSDYETALFKRPSGIHDDELARFRAMDRAELEEYAAVVTGQLDKVIETVQHWRKSEEDAAAKGYIAPFRYSLAELAVTIRNAIFWANWPATEHRDIFTEPESDGDD